MKRLSPALRAERKRRVVRGVSIASTLVAHQCALPVLNVFASRQADTFDELKVVYTTDREMVLKDLGLTLF
jgi:hypothetical protein